jgi:hypothetical protein
LGEGCRNGPCPCHAILDSAGIIPGDINHRRWGILSSTAARSKREYTQQQCEPRDSLGDPIAWLT